MRKLLVILFFIPFISQSQTVTSVGVGEYFTSYLTSNGRIYGTVWGGFKGVSRDTTIDFGILNVRWTNGGQYDCIYINNSGAAGVSTTDTVGRVFKDNAGGGDTGVNKYPIDSTNARFDSVSVAYVWFQTYLAIRNGDVYYWGFDGNTYGALNLKGSGSTFFINKPYKLGQPGGGRKATKIVIGDQDIPSFIALMDDGTVWKWTQGSGTPSQVSGLTGITDIGGVARDCFIALTASDVKAWGQFTSVVGLSEPTASPTSILTTLTNAGVRMPIKEIANNSNILALIDADDSLWVMGDNPMGEGGIGTEITPYRTYKNGTSSGPFAWDFTRGQARISTPTKLRGKFKNLCNSGNIAFYFHAQDLHNSWYSWGRNKATALANGQEKTNMDTYPCWGDVPAPKNVNALTITWPSGVGVAFNINDSLAPVANAGVDRDITTTSDSIYADKSFQQEQSITGYSWSQISGPNTATIGSSTLANSLISGLITGTYVFRVAVTNHHGDTTTDDVTLYVSIQSPPSYRWHKPANSRVIIQHR